MRQTLRKFEECSNGEKIEVVFKDGKRNQGYFQGIIKEEGSHYLSVSHLNLDGDSFSGMSDQTEELPLYNIGYVQFPETDQKISAMPFQKLGSN